MRFCNLNIVPRCSILTEMAFLPYAVLKRLPYDRILNGIDIFYLTNMSKETISFIYSFHTFIADLVLQYNTS